MQILPRTVGLVCRTDPDTSVQIDLLDRETITSESCITELSLQIKIYEKQGRKSQEILNIIFSSSLYSICIFHWFAFGKNTSAVF